MPRRYGLKYSRSHRRYGRRHHASASKISRAWRVRKRRKTSLLARTALANRRAVKRLKTDVETKVLEANIAGAANQWQAGQICLGVTPDETGQWVDYGVTPATDGTLACDLLSPLSQGTGSNQRVGAWVQMKSLTIKYSITNDTRSPDVLFGILLVHDQQPSIGNASLSDVLARTGSGPVQNNVMSMSMAFQNLQKTGKDGRFKILWHKKHRLSAKANAYTDAQVPPIVTAAAGTAPSVYGNTTRAAYTHQNRTSIATGAAMTIYGSKTLKVPYKINYGTNSSSQPENQSILLMAYQLQNTNQPAASAGGCRCVLQWRSRFRFKDA